ncbi:hypothetical protein GF406_24055 [candidate division KSB1 bacterium]|nr:hypothetical protein [candidate division KSB1 bacterium]
MQEKGIITSVGPNDKAMVKLVRDKKCQGCHACDLFGDGSASIRAVNGIDAKPGDVVEVNIGSDKVLFSSFIVFLLPILLMIVGYFIGDQFFSPQGYSGEEYGIGGAGIAFLFSLFISKQVDKAVSKKHPSAAHITNFSSLDDNHHLDCQKTQA